VIEFSKSTISADAVAMSEGPTEYAKKGRKEK
jgi:hypothetical protein